MDQREPVESPFGIRHKLYVQIEQGTICESNEREGIHFNHPGVDNGKTQFNTNQK